MAKDRKPSALTSRQIFLHGSIGLMFLVGLVLAVQVARLYVERRFAAPTRPPKVVLVNRPVWMSDFLADQIIKSAQPVGLHSAFEHQLLVSTVDALKSNPWVRQVNQVRRVFADGPGDTLEIDCDFRAPVAVAKWGQFFYLVDGQGIRLPERYTVEELPKIMFGQDGKLNIRIITGVAKAPNEAGKTWPGEDLSSGLELARLLAGHDYAEQIRQIDVSNFVGRRDRREAQIVLLTQFGTQIRWGRAPSAKDAFIEIAPSAKLSALEYIYAQKGRVDANEPWIDIRFDRITCPAPVQKTASANES